MTQSIYQISDDFWNIRGHFRVARLVDLGTHASLVRRKSGGFLLLDSWTLDDAQRKQIMALTDGGTAVEAILNLHPFHTLHCRAMHRDFPTARLYGTARHLDKRPDLPWQDELIESTETQALFSEDLDFSVPKGVTFVSDDEKVHFASVLAIHRASGTLHVDDTLTFIRLPSLLRSLGLGDRVAFHPTLKKVLEPRAGASGDFRAWATGLAESCSGVTTLCAAHVSHPLTPKTGQATVSARILRALERVEPALTAHEAKYG